MEHTLSWNAVQLPLFPSILQYNQSILDTRMILLIKVKCDAINCVGTNYIMFDRLLSTKRRSFQIINKYVHHLPQYVDITECLNESAMITCIGESLDILLSHRDISQFTVDAFKYMTFYKMSYFSFYTPIATSDIHATCIFLKYIVNMEEMVTLKIRFCRALCLKCWMIQMTFCATQKLVNIKIKMATYTLKWSSFPNMRMNWRRWMRVCNSIDVENSFKEIKNFAFVQI